jgi:hypothetical protein
MSRRDINISGVAARSPVRIMAATPLIDVSNIIIPSIG